MPIYGVMVPFHILTIKNATNNQARLSHQPPAYAIGPLRQCVAGNSIRAAATVLFRCHVFLHVSCSLPLAFVHPDALSSGVSPPGTERDSIVNLVSVLCRTATTRTSG